MLLFITESTFLFPSSPASLCLCSSASLHLPGLSLSAPCLLVRAGSLKNVVDQYISNASHMCGLAAHFDDFVNHLHAFPGEHVS